MFERFKKAKITNEPEKIKEVLTRSIDTIYPNKKAFEDALNSGKQLRIYMGIDPTATYVHLGHSTNYIILKRLHELGHKIVVLIGDFTAMIGDPSDKNAARKRLTQKDVAENLKTFKAQIGNILNFNDKNNPIEFRFNSEWLRKLNFNDAVEIASHFTVQRMLERDNFEKRIAEKKPLYVHEFFYPLMQGYDSVVLEADVEIGGSDQTFNMLAGRQLVKDYQNREKIVVTTTLLENPVTGEKLMSKSLGTGIALNESPNDMFGKTMALPDEAIVQVLIDCTYLSMEEINKIKTSLETGANPRDMKVRLAKELIKMYHGEDAANKAEQNFINTFKKGQIPDDATEISAPVGTKLSELLVSKTILESKSEFRRLINEKAIKEIRGDQENVIADPDCKIETSMNLKVGKRRFVKIKVS